MKPSILILHASGTNRDQEAAWACQVAGGAPDIVHINQLRSGERKAADYQMLLIPGGFSYGDALGAGSRLALDLQLHFQDMLNHFLHAGKPILGICNGFQVLVKAGLLPGWEEPPGLPRSVTLTANAQARFECRWVHLAVNKDCRADYLNSIDELIFCPVAHGEGNLQTQDDATLARLEENGLVALRYVDADGRGVNGTYPLNPNGSAGDIAGLCNQTGNVVGLMPHPEDHILPVQNPLGKVGRLGLQFFEAMIQRAG